MRNAVWGVLVVVPALAGCGNLYWEKEAWSPYYSSPSAETERTLLERKVVRHWKEDPRNKETVAILEKYNVILAGSRIPRDYYEILNGTGTQRLGHINEEGVFFRWTRDGGMAKVGEYRIIDTGMKVFFGYPLTDKLGFEEIDPYAD